MLNGSRKRLLVSPLRSLSILNVATLPLKLFVICFLVIYELSKTFIDAIYLSVNLTLKPGSIEEPSQWRILFDSGRINSNKQFRLSAMSVSIIKFFAWNNLKLNSGFGTNMVNVLSYNISDNYDFQTNYVSFGLSTKLFGLVLSPQVLFGSKINFISISIGDFF